MNVTVQDFQAVALAQAEQVVNLQAVNHSLNRQLEVLTAEHARCPKSTADDTPGAALQ